MVIIAKEHRDIKIFFIKFEGKELLYTGEIAYVLRINTPMNTLVCSVI
jgi:hypothetical protein